MYDVRLDQCPAHSKALLLYYYAVVIVLTGFEPYWIPLFFFEDLNFSSPSKGVLYFILQDGKGFSWKVSLQGPALITVSSTLLLLSLHTSTLTYMNTLLPVYCLRSRIPGGQKQILTFFPGYFLLSIWYCVQCAAGTLLIGKKYT